MKTITAEKAISDVRIQAEKIKNDRPQRFPEAASVGDWWRQGDVYITLLDRLPMGATPVEPPIGLQLAPGSTQGSRHCLDSAKGVAFYRFATPGELDGLVLALTEERTITHPEHGWLVLPPATYRIGYQRSLDAEERQRRVAD